MVKHRVTRNSVETQVRFTRSLCAGLLAALCFCPPLGHAQIVRDGSLGAPIGAPGVLEPTGPNFRIDSTLGEIRSGNGTINLFHSFSEFNVQLGESATFFNSHPGSINNILNRVTSDNPSTINGLLASEIPGANLYLLNPRGVIFGPNASLDIGATVGQPGSFFVSTADYVRLGTAGDSSAGIFSAHPFVLDALTSAPVTAFGFLGPPATITFTGSRLPGDLLDPAIHPETGNPIPVPAGQTFAVIGGDITVGPDPATGTPSSIVAPGGQMDIFSTGSAGELHYPDFTHVQNVNGETFTAMGTVRLTGNPGIPGTLDVTDYFTERAGAGGAVRIRGGQFEMDNASVIADTIADVPGATTGISVAMTGNIMLKNVSSLVTENFGPAGSGAIEVSGRNVTVQSGSSIQTASIEGDLGLGPLGPSGNITVTGSESITVTGTEPVSAIRSNISTQASGATGDSGLITLSAPTVNVKDFGLVKTFSISSGSAGGIQIVDNTMDNVIVNDLNVLSGGAIEISSPGFSKTGPLTIDTANSVTVSGQFNPGNPSRIALLRNEFGTTQEVGLISIKTGQFSVTDGAEVLVEGDLLSGVHLDIDATIGATVSNGGLIAVVNGAQQLGSLTIKVPSISVNNAEIRSRTFSDRDAGAMKLEATTGDISLENGSRIRVSTENGSGDGGSLLLMAPLGSIRLSGGSSAESSSVNSSSGNGGSITAQASNLISLSGSGTGLFTVTDTTSTGSGGDITATAGQSMNLNDGASISASSAGTGNAGNISINAGQQFEMHDSSVKTEAAQASGGKIDLRAVQLVRLINSTISTSVLDGAGGGGDIFIDPNSVVLQNSQILAQAIHGAGGNITIFTPLFLADSSSLVSASSQFGLNGTVTIQSPASNLSGSLGTLSSKTQQTQSLLTQRCAALANGQASSFVVAGHEQLPADPGSWLTSPLALAALAENLDTGDAVASAPAVIATHDTDTVSLRRLTPVGFLIANFADSEATGCHS